MKEYKKPCTIGLENERGVVPLAGAVAAASPAAALLAGYAAGRAVKQMMEINQIAKKQNYLQKVILV